MTPEELRALDRQVAEHEGLTRRENPICERAEERGVTNIEQWGWPTEDGKWMAGSIAICTGCGDIDLPPYSTQWLTGGPLIEKYGLAVGRCRGLALWCLPGAHWVADAEARNDFADKWAEGETPLIAICRAVLALPKEVGG